MSEIKVDTLTGKTTANDITVTVGASATQSLEQGLAKQWIQYAGATNEIKGSINTASVTDNGPGNFTVNFSNNFSTNVDMASVSSVYAASSVNRTHQYGAMTTSTCLLILMSNGSLADILGTGGIFGDLA